jgi:ATP-dependent Clp protease protease subunit
MIHQPLVGARGQASDILIAAEEIRKTRDELCSIISLHSGQPFEKVLADADRDFWLTSEEALEYGMIDNILTGKKTR